MTADVRRLVPVLSLAAMLGACAQGPADFVSGDFFRAPPATARPVLAPDEREDLARDLDATARRQDAEGRAAAGGPASAVALTVLRQQQEEEARALLSAAEAADAEGGAPGACDPADPGCVPPSE